ncbi:hypothetical protein MAR_036149 [Mya arenaria]|uniref:Uncharacterized protein n=1 Tax=Mya arenaria TaxID=6604 RepID=A0ABY7EM67_MYAAR|nr:hypothetical protein MAR_036149 [Mya arenaria]
MITENTNQHARTRDMIEENTNQHARTHDMIGGNFNQLARLLELNGDVLDRLTRIERATEKKREEERGEIRDRPNPVHTNGDAKPCNLYDTKTEDIEEWNGRHGKVWVPRKKDLTSARFCKSV